MAGHPDDGIHDDDFADFLWMPDGVEEADGTSPVMHNQVELRQLEHVIQKRLQIADMLRKTVVPILRLVGIATADVVRSDGADVLFLNGTDEIAVHERPRRIAVEHDGWKARTDIKIVHPLVEGRLEPVRVKFIFFFPHLSLEIVKEGTAVKSCIEGDNAVSNI